MRFVNSPTCRVPSIGRMSVSPLLTIGTNTVGMLCRLRRSATYLACHSARGLLRVAIRRGVMKRVWGVGMRVLRGQGRVGPARGQIAYYLLGHRFSDSIALRAVPVGRTDLPLSRGGNKTQRCDRHIMASVW